MTIRVLLNENFPVPAQVRLRAAGLDVLAIRERHAGLPDEQVLALAVEENRWIVTFDRDYGELVFGRGLQPPPAIILLRVPHYRPEEPARWVIDLLSTAADYAGHFVVYTGDTVRKRLLLRRVGSVMPDDG